MRKSIKQFGLLASTVLVVSSVLPAYANDMPSKFFKPAGKLYFYYVDEWGGQKNQSAVTLSDGTILLVGGTDEDITLAIGMSPGSRDSRRAEIFNPNKQMSIKLSDSPLDLYGKKAECFLLPSGLVLITAPELANFFGGNPNSKLCDCGRLMDANQRSSCEKTTALLFDPKSGTYKSLFHLRPVRTRASTG